MDLGVKAGGRGFPRVNGVRPPFRQLERHRVELLFGKLCEKERGEISRSIQMRFTFGKSSSYIWEIGI
jgi:hypothetical protein